MTVPVLTFFSQRSGIGKTWLIYHLSFMMSELGQRVLTVDLDPQAHLTAAFLDDSSVETLWEGEEAANTIYRAIRPLTEGEDMREPEGFEVQPGLHLIPGDMALAGFEETLSAAWLESMGEDNLDRPFQILSAFWEVSQAAARRQSADLILVDAGPNLGAINRSAMIASDFVVLALGPDFASLQGLKQLGPNLQSLRESWSRRLVHLNRTSFALPKGRMRPLGYVVQQFGVRLDRPVLAYDHWVKRVPEVYAKAILGQSSQAETPAQDVNCLAMLRSYRSLVPMARERHKPIFALTPADGAIGSHAQAVRDAYKDFKALAEKILERMATGPAQADAGHR